MDVTHIITLSTLLALSGETSEISEDLVFVLQELFMSDVILFTRDEENFDKSAKKFFKLQNFKVFLGTINLNDHFFLQNFKRELMIPYQNIMIVSEFSTRLFEKLIKFYSLSRMASFIWVCFTNGDVGNDIKKYEITDVYQISEKSDKIYSIFGHFKFGELKIANKPSFYDRRRDLQGYRFNLSMSPFPDFTKRYEKIWELFSEGMNFSVRSDYPIFGSVQSNGTLTGVFKLLDEHKVDITPSIFVVTRERLDLFDVIFPTSISQTLMYLNLQTELNWDSYITPFSSTVWIAIAAWIALSTVMLQIITKGAFRKSLKGTFTDPFFHIMRALCYQAGDFNFSSPALNAAYLMPYLLASILVQYYSAQLLSDLTDKTVVVPFRNLKEAIDDGTYQVIALKNTFAETYLRTNEGYEATALRKKGLLEPSDKVPITTAAAFHRLCEGRYILVSISAMEFTVEENCLITELKAAVFFDSLGILVWKGFPYKNDLIKLMRQVQFAGLWKLKQSNIIIRPPDLVEFEPLSIELIFPIFLLHFLIIVICGFIFLCELYWTRIKGSSKKLVKKFYNKDLSFQLRSYHE